MRGTEVGMTVEEQAEPVMWTLTDRWCANGDLLVADDFPPDQRM